MDTVHGAPNRKIVILSCNVDDMTGEEIGYAREQLFKAGAQEFYTIPVRMKKGRDGVEIRVVCKPSEADRMAGVLMKNTSTFGVRRQEMKAYVLERKCSVIHTPFGDVRLIVAEGYGITKKKLEYDDVCAYADKAGVSLAEAREEIFACQNEQAESL